MRNACSCNSSQSHSWTCPMGSPGRLKRQKSSSSTPPPKKRNDEQLKLEMLEELREP